jgi:primase-polymerase (primpol)-like protein
VSTPSVLAPNFDAIPAALRERRQWVLWRLEWRRQEKKPTKVPYQPSGAHAASTDPATWNSIDAVRAAYEAGGFDGVGFVFTADDPLVGIDLDGCRDAATGELAPWAQAVIARFDTYCEISPSGTGIHLIMVGELPPGGRKRGPVECYEQERYFTVTARSPDGVPVRDVVDRTAALAAWHAEAFPPQGKSARPAPRAPVAPPVDADDDRLLERARGAKNGKKFRGLFDDGDASGHGSHSEADLALCAMLAFWTRGDAERVDRLFRRSALFRPKWDASAGHGETYGQRTVRIAVERSASGRPEVLFTGLGGDVPLHQILPPAVTALAARCAETVYARGDVLSRVVRATEPGEDGIERSAAPRIVRLPDSILRERLDEACQGTGYQVHP